MSYFEDLFLFREWIFGLEDLYLNGLFFFVVIGFCIGWSRFFFVEYIYERF